VTEFSRCFFVKLTIKMFSLATTDKAVDVSLVDAKADEAVGKSSSAG